MELHNRVKYWLRSLKMEEATFLISGHAKHKWQFLDPDTYFVHHLSQYEHLIHKKHGLSKAKRSTLEMSTAAFNGECSNTTRVGNLSYLALIPFYGGLPPNTDENARVHSRGQGNSLMDPGVKILQTMATLCSCFRYFGRAVIAVAQESDRILVEETLSGMSPIFAERTHILQLEVSRPANLPFHLLVWSQDYIRRWNCNMPFTNPTHCMRRLGPKAVHGGGRVNQSFFKELKTKSPLPILYVYYTESDQILRIKDDYTFQAISAVSNQSCFIFPYRREKVTMVDETDKYMDGLSDGRVCGKTGYALDWPRSHDIFPFKSQYQ